MNMFISGLFFISLVYFLSLDRSELWLLLAREGGKSGGTTAHTDLTVGAKGGRALS